MSDGFVTVAQCVEGLPHGRFVWELLLYAFLLWFMLGAINESAPLAFSLISSEWGLSENTALFMSASLALGNFISIVIGGWLADQYGRLAVIQPALLCTLAAGIFLQISHTFVQVLAARFILGLSSGALLGVVPPLVAECLPRLYRGFYMTIWCIGWPVGALLSVLMGFFLPSINWKAFYTIILVPSLLLYVCTRAELLLESPRWLYLAGRREEGYNALLDMYDKQLMMLPWEPQTIAVTTGSQRPPPGKWASMSNLASTMWLGMVMFTSSAAAQSMKLWIPTMLIAQEADDSEAAATAADAELNHPMIPSSSFHFAHGPHAVSFLSQVQPPLFIQQPNKQVTYILVQGYCIQMVGVLVMAYASTFLTRKSIVQWSLLAAAFFTLCTLVLAESGFPNLCGPLVGSQLAAQVTSFNFLQVFVCEHFPTVNRAWVSAFANFGAQLGNFVIPVIVGFVVKQWSAGVAVISFSALYVLSWAISFKLPLQVSPEEPLHDIDEVSLAKRNTKASVRKRDWASYSTMS